MQDGVFLLGRHESIPGCSSLLTGDHLLRILCPFPLPRLGAVSTWERKCWLHIQSPDRRGGARPSSYVYVSLWCSEAWLRSWHLPPFPCIIVRISWVLFQSSPSCFHRHLLTFLELLQAHPVTPTEQRIFLEGGKLHPRQPLYCGTIQTLPALSGRPISWDPFSNRSYWAVVQREILFKYLWSW